MMASSQNTSEGFTPMSNITPMQLRNMTVPQLREMAKAQRNRKGQAVGGFSKMRKAELIDFIVAASEEDAPLHEQPMSGSPAAVAQAEEEFVGQDDIEANVQDALPSQFLHVPTVGTFEQNEFLAAVGFALSADMTEQDRRDLDMAKYRGRYEGKAVCVEVPFGHSTRLVTGAVVNGQSRPGLVASDLQTGNDTLLLSVRHNSTRYGNPRVTLHRAEDVVLV